MKKAQLQIMENVFMLLIVFAILAVAFIFVIANQRAEQKDKLEEFKELDMIKKAQIINILPEMQCSDNNNIDPDCFDVYKIESFSEVLKKDKFYYLSLLGKIKIEITQYDPSPETPEDKRIVKIWKVYDYLKINPDYKPKEIKKLEFPVLLKDVVENNNYFGMILLEVYE